MTDNLIYVIISHVLKYKYQYKIVIYMLVPNFMTVLNILILILQHLFHLCIIHYLLMVTWQVCINTWQIILVWALLGLLMEKVGIVECGITNEAGSSNSSLIIPGYHQCNTLVRCVAAGFLMTVPKIILSSVSLLWEYKVTHSMIYVIISPLIR